MASSFTQFLPYLHIYSFVTLLGVTMMCLLTQQQQHFICSNAHRAFGFTHNTSQKSVRQHRVL
jgi:hypothetical protein